MNKSEFITLVAEKMGTSKSSADTAITAVFDSLIDVMKANDSYTQQGFGTFSVAFKDAHDSRNPKTGEIVKVAAKHVPKFSYSNKAKDAIKDI